MGEPGISERGFNCVIQNHDFAYSHKNNEACKSEKLNKQLFITETALSAKQAPDETSNNILGFNCIASI